MRWAPSALFLLTVPAFSQVVVNPDDLGRILRLFEPRPENQLLHCEVTPLPPAMSFAFRVRAGYVIHVPWDQSHSPDQLWSVLTTVTPQDGDRGPTYLHASHPAATALRTEAGFDLRGFYLLGLGRYTVEAALRDNRGRTCRKEWDVIVKPSRTDVASPAIPANTVRPISTEDDPAAHPLDAPPVRLSVLLNAAAVSSHRTALRPGDRAVLLDSLIALMERLPVTSVRLVVFSLEQQREVFRQENFSLSDLKKVTDAIDALQLSTVDVHVLEKPTGYIDLLTGLINGELSAPTPADRVVFLGPLSRYGKRIPADAVPAPGPGNMRFYYVRYDGARGPAMPPQSADGSGSAPGGIRPGSRPMPSTVGSGTGAGGGGGGARGSNGPADSGSTSTNATLPRPAANPSENSPGDAAPGRGGSGGRGRMDPFPKAPGPPVEPQSDIIDEAVARLKGKTLAIHSPTDLAKAIRQIAYR